MPDREVAWHWSQAKLLFPWRWSLSGLPWYSLIFAALNSRIATAPFKFRSASRATCSSRPTMPCFDSTAGPHISSSVAGRDRGWRDEWNVTTGFTRFRICPISASIRNARATCPAGSSVEQPARRMTKDLREVKAV